jgi:hypothetical protein
MRTRQFQLGITLMGFVIVMAITVFFLLIGAKLFPIYSEYMAVKASMKQVQNMPGAATFAPDRLWNALDTSFNIAYVENVKRNNVELNRKNGVFLRIKYEVRKPLVYNLDVVAMFDHTVELTRPAIE